MCCGKCNEFLLTEPTALVVAKHHELILGIALHSAKVVELTFSLLFHVIEVIQNATNLTWFNLLRVLVHFSLQKNQSQGTMRARLFSTRLHLRQSLHFNMHAPGWRVAVQEALAASVFHTL